MPNPIIAVILMAAAAYIPRVVPLITITKEIDNIYIKSFLKYVPFAVLGSLTFPDIFYSTGEFITALCGTAIALFLAYKEKSLVVVALAAILTVYITSFLI